MNTYADEFISKYGKDIHLLSQFQILTAFTYLAQGHPSECDDYVKSQIKKYL